MDEYYERLMRVSTNGDWIGWLSYFLIGVARQAHEAIDDSERVLTLQADYHEILKQSPRAPRSARTN